MLVTTQELREFIPDTLGQGTEDGRPFIRVAHILVTDRLVGKGLSDDMLKTLELFLAAHFAVMSLEHGGLTLRKIMDTQEEYQQLSSSGFGLSSTRYGQQAIAMDSTNTLATLAGGRKALFRVL